MMQDNPNPPPEETATANHPESQSETQCQVDALPSLLAKALTMAGDLTSKLAGEKGQAQTVAQLRALEDVLRLAWEERIELSLKVLELGTLNLKYKQQARLGREVLYDDGFYWLRAPGRARVDGPLCPTCWEVEDKLVHLARLSLDAGRIADAGEWRQWECRRCNEVFLRKEGGQAVSAAPDRRDKDGVAEGADRD